MKSDRSLRNVYAYVYGDSHGVKTYEPSDHRNGPCTCANDGSSRHRGQCPVRYQPGLYIVTHRQSSETHQEPLKVDRLDIPDLSARDEFLDLPVGRVVSVVEQDCDTSQSTL